MFFSFSNTVMCLHFQYFRHQLMKTFNWFMNDIIIDKSMTYLETVILSIQTVFLPEFVKKC